MNGILVLCTANQCRSPVAEGLLRQRLVKRNIDLPLRSAGFLEGGVASPSEVIRAATMFGLDLSRHRSHQIDWATVPETDLIITMMRRHVRDVAVHEPGVWRKTFTIRELVRRGHDHGARQDGQPLDDWIEEVHLGRTPKDLLGDDASDDVEDTMGGIPADYDLMVETLFGLTHELVQLIYPGFDR
jgi:protein-tyrosine phosphatase